MTSAFFICFYATFPHQLRFSCRFTKSCMPKISIKPTNYFVIKRTDLLGKHLPVSVSKVWVILWECLLSSRIGSNRQITKFSSQNVFGLQKMFTDLAGLTVSVFGCGDSLANRILDNQYLLCSKRLRETPKPIEPATSLFWIQRTAIVLFVSASIFLSMTSQGSY